MSQEIVYLGLCSVDTSKEGECCCWVECALKCQLPVVTE